MSDLAAARAAARALLARPVASPAEAAECKAGRFEMGPVSDRRVAWVRAQLDATEAAAKACSGDGRWTAEDIAHIAPNLGVEPRAHIAMNDPAAVLADVETKRAILDYAERIFANAREHPDDLASKGAHLAMHGVVRNLAEGFKGRPGYEEAMRDV